MSSPESTPRGAATADRRPSEPLRIEFPESLPVSGRRDEIMQAIRDHQVVIVCGETGSGKTTQLPKIALAMGRGKLNAPPGRGRLIGHTQPRRIAASSVAKRIAEELRTPLGDVVGYKVRFQDRLSRDASVKLMTDGILLAETQTDPLLKAYDTLIIDEAHERSLNIDFLLGYLREILPKRPDLKVIVTSATIDADRFARHFATPAPRPSGGSDPHEAGERGGDMQPAPGRPKPAAAPSGGSDPHEVGERGGHMLPAPVLYVSGRTFPVEVRWRPFEESRDFGLNEAIAEGVDELWRDPRMAGDILVFLPGEREIREAADHLRGHLSHQPALRSAEVLPLFARLSQAEQDRIFEGHGNRRLVLATNVAETSLTVPGIRYVIDAGTARVKRYSYRSKVEQLLVEPVSQAAANQRAGRCGRVAEGICIRLYDEEDFAARPRFTDPEILRSSLAGVILRMKSLHLGDVEAFPFIEPPQRRAITDGYQLLAELGAVDAANELTPIGQELSHLPLDPRVGRMILEARERGALAEVLVIASALSVQDVRDRPMEAQAQADQAHAKFDDERSEFSGYLTLWKWLQDARGGQAPANRREMQARTQAPRQASAAVLPVSQRLHRPAPAAPDAPDAANAANAKPAPAPGSPDARSAGAARPALAARAAADAGAVPVHRLSNRQYDQLLRQNFISVRRVREWRDIHSQLLTVVNEHRWKTDGPPAGYEAIHLSMLSGLLGNIGFRGEEDEAYLGARGIRFHRHPGAHLRKRPGRWIVAAELVETTRLFGRGIAAIEPGWIEEVGAHLLRKQLLDPHWEKKSGQVIALERGTLYGITIYSGRRIDYAQVDPAGARELFIREGLVAGEWDSRLPFLAANRRLVREVENLEHKARRQDVLVDDELIYAFYEAQLPAEVTGALALETWWREASRAQPRLLHLTREELMRHQAAGITTQAFPPTVRLGGVDCSATYLHEPGDARDGLTVTVPLFVLNQVSEERCEWLVGGMLRDKLQALLKSLPQKPRARLVPLPESATQLAAELSSDERFAQGPLLDVLAQAVRARTGLEVKRSDFRPDTLPAHLFMNLRVTDEHGRQLGMGRSLAALKAELGTQARGAFQALAGLKLGGAGVASGNGNGSGTGGGGGGEVDGVEEPASSRRAASGSSRHRGPGERGRASSASASDLPSSAPPARAASSQSPAPSERYTAWTFGELPELMELRRGNQAVVGFPALVDQGDAVVIEVFDEPALAAARHRAGLRRLVSLQIRDALKYLQKNIPDFQKSAVTFMPLGTADELLQQVIDVALDRAFLQEPLPTDGVAFARRIDEGRGRLTLIAQEVGRLLATILAEYAQLLRKVKETRGHPEASADVQQQLGRLMHKRFLADTPWVRLAHLPRYLKGMTLRLDKLRTDPARDAQRLQEVRTPEQRFWRLVAERKGQVDERMTDYRWLLEELRVSLFAQELRTPQPVSAKRLDKAWSQLNA